MTVKERLEEYLKYKKINKSAFGREIGVSNAYISSIRKSIQPDKLKAIALSYSDLNIDWLLTGEGKMLKTDVNSENTTQQNKIEETGSSNINPLKDSVMKEAMMSDLVEVVKSQNGQIDRLIDQNGKLLNQIEKIGDRSERMLSIIENKERQVRKNDEASEKTPQKKRAYKDMAG